MQSHHGFNPSLDWANPYLTLNHMVALNTHLIRVSLKASYSFNSWILI
ncbi:hypothetical protein Zm00014a_004336 [Zea mays]|uniref:Uncharacterized protein n=1 Tax=Zea mays TaxID=4577 RepID=A0A3L6FIP4_MAIZE|nr:hypothetical protein Zm00014a_004336 [Zea mays]